MKKLFYYLIETIVKDFDKEVALRLLDELKDNVGHKLTSEECQTLKEAIEKLKQGV